MKRIQIGWLTEPLDTAEDIDEFEQTCLWEDEAPRLESINEMTDRENSPEGVLTSFSWVPGGKLFNPIPVFIEVEPGQYLVREPQGATDADS